ncbi:hypothetical protein [Microbacterium maritypicum]|uniref:hypothetical protein n=1 Tax=Microbacterium maritypicum TaxID=33918 RepID=UPI003A8CADD0
MSVYDHDVITRARIVRERLAQLRLHQTEERQRLHALALHELLDAGYSTREAGELLGLSRTFVHRVASGAAEPPEERPEFEEIDAAVEQFILG